MSGVAGAPSDAGLTVLPGCSTSPITERVEIDGADAVRCALVRGEAAQGTGSQLPERSAQEARRLEHYWQHAQEILQRIDPALLTAFLPSITGFLSELEVEDRAVLARWERARVAILADYDARDYAAAYRRLSRFLANDLPRYRALVAPRLDPSAGGAPRRAALRTLHHLVRRSSLLLGPIAPHTAELVYGATTSAGTSLFEASVEPVNASLMDEERARAWDRWRTVLEALDRFRGSLGISLHTPLPAVVVIVSIEELAELLRHDRPTLERLARVDRFEAFGPATPWTGRRADLEPVLSEIQRVYPTEATQIVHLLRRQPVHRRDGPRLSGELSVVLQGTPRRILPSMVTYVERFPDRALPASWRLGEMYVELPAGHPLPSRIPPPLSPDAFRLVQHVERELRQRSTPQSPPRPPLVIATLDPLASELRRVAPALATYLDVPELRVVDDVREFPLTETTHGRTKTGVRWWLHLPGLPRRPGHVKHPPARSPGSRLRPPQPAEETGEISVDYIAPEYLAREEQVRALMAELDGVLGAPLLGFAKTAGAWDAGLQSRAAFEAAPFDTLAALPGFGWPLAKALVVKFGHAAPVRPRWESGRRDLPLNPPARAPLRTSTQGSGEGNGTGKAMAPPHFDGAALPSAAKDETSMPSAEPKPPTSERRPAGRLEPGPASSPRPALETAVSPLPPSPMAEPAPTPPPEDEDARAGETTHRARAEPSLEIAFPPPTPSLEPDQSPRLPLEAGPRLDAEGTPGLPVVHRLGIAHQHGAAPRRDLELVAGGPRARDRLAGLGSWARPQSNDLSRARRGRTGGDRSCLRVPALRNRIGPRGGDRLSRGTRKDPLGAPGGTPFRSRGSGFREPGRRADPPGGRGCTRGSGPVRFRFGGGPWDRSVRSCAAPRLARPTCFGARADRRSGGFTPARGGAGPRRHPGAAPPHRNRGTACLRSASSPGRCRARHRSRDPAPPPRAGPCSSSRDGSFAPARAIHRRRAGVGGSPHARRGGRCPPSLEPVGGRSGRLPLVPPRPFGSSWT